MPCSDIVDCDTPFSANDDDAVFHPVFSNIDNFVPYHGTADCETPLNENDAVFHPNYQM